MEQKNQHLWGLFSGSEGAFLKDESGIPVLRRTRDKALLYITENKLEFLDLVPVGVPTAPGATVTL